MNDHDLNLLHDDLHDLAGGIAPVSSSTARDRARRGIARRTRNRRAAASAAAAVVIVAAGVFVAVDRDTKKSQRPIGTTTPTVSSTPTTSTPTTSAPTTTAPRSPILSTIPPVSELPAATASYSKTFAWGTADDQVAFHTPQGEGVSGGPLAFTADAAGNIAMLDHSSSRIVRFDHGSAAADHIALADPGVTTAVFDSLGRVIVANSRLAVYGPGGKTEGSWDQTTIGRLEVDGPNVYKVRDDNTRMLLLRDDGSGYVPVENATLVPAAVEVDVVADTQLGVMVVSAGGTEYRLTTGLKDLRAVRLLPDRSLVFVVGFVQSDSGHQDQPQTYVIGRIDRAGHARYATVAASTGYLVNGPGFVINDDGIAVMGSTTAGGVTVSYYPFS